MSSLALAKRFAVVQHLESRYHLAAPPLAWSTYLGGANSDYGRCVAVDSAGSVYVAGNSQSSDWGGFNGVPWEMPDAFITKFAPDGSVAWTSFIGGDSTDAVYGIAVDGSGNVYVAGQTNSTNFDGGLPGFGGGHDAFVTRLNTNGTVAWTRFLGGAGYDSGAAIALDNSGNVFVAGYTDSAGWASGGADTVHGGNDHNDGFIAKVTPAGAVAWSSYIGGQNSDSAYGIATDASGNAYVTGHTYSENWVAGGSDTTYEGLGNAFAARFNSNGTLAWSSYISATFWPLEYGYGNSVGFAIDTDAAGNSYITGEVWANDFDYGKNAFVAKISPGGSRQWLVYPGSTVGDEVGRGIALDATGNIWITGTTTSPDFALNGYDTTFGGYDGDAFVAVLGSGGSLEWSTYVGGEGEEHGRGIALDAFGNAYVTGYTASDGWTQGGYDTSYGAGFYDAYVVKLGAPTPSVLAVNGTDGNDVMAARVFGGNVEIIRNGTIVASRDLELVSYVKIDALGGHDRIDVETGVPACQLFGGTGNDTINAGDGADLIYGNDGDDVLSGGSGADTVYGNFGNDQIAGGLHRDSLLAGLGNDVVTAGDGPDTVLGGDGTDVLRGGKGADYVEGRGKSDTMYGGIGNDTLIGGAGSDAIYGEDNDDWLYASAASVFRDTLNGGTGTDRYESDSDDVLLQVEIALL